MKWKSHKIIKNNKMFLKMIIRGGTMKNKTMRASILCAIKGIKLAFQTEKNYKYYGAIALVTLIMNVLLKVSYMEYCLFILLAIGVFAMENVNTAIEFFANKVSPEYDEEIGKVKDIAAGAVLLSGCSFIIIEGVILISKL